MWVFGYGSLMWDDWELNYGGLKHIKAILYGYSRAFNKKSVKNWGSPKFAGPTLGLEKEDGEKCIGIAFEFSNNKKDDILAYLKQREGKSFKLEILAIELHDGQRVTAFTPVNVKNNATYLEEKDIKQLTRMVKLAKGANGNCFDYVKNLRDKLIDMGIKDRHVEKLWDSIINGKSS